MTDYQETWAKARNQLTAAAESLGFPGELADLLAKQLKSTRAIERMTAYLYQARPSSLEMIVDEMLAIRTDMDAWKKKKEGESAQAGISAWLNSEERWKAMDDAEDERNVSGQSVHGWEGDNQ